MAQIPDAAPELPKAFQLGEWWVDPMLNRISRDGHNVQLRPRAMDVLVCLATSNGEVATKQHLIDTVWRTEFVTENALTHVIAELRTELGDDARNPSYIENIPRRGYRLIAEISGADHREPSLAQVIRLPKRDSHVEFDDMAHPYPGLAAFTENDAEFFFGRESEVLRMWRTITSRRLLGLIGPSGVGKSSFLQAGVMASTPDGWGVVMCHPGESPFANLARALVPEFSGDVESITGLFDISDGDGAVAMISRWRDRHQQALLIVDQFEELFTQNTPDVQEGFITTLRRLVDSADLHVLLAMRDDFLHKCHSHDRLRPIFDDLSALEKPDSDSLRRALEEPASRLGYAFEDDSIVSEMVGEIEGEHGALPLLAFAAAQLWERRDRGGRLLTRQAYTAIGGVTGALARHADETLDRLGPSCLPIVRELFRNLVTVENTRAVREREDLLSVFPESEREAAAGVVKELVDARLLTSYEDDSTAADPAPHIQIIHESLLSNWPRLVGWRSQDADALRFRHELRQASRTWDERGRTDDLVWTGGAQREFEVWRHHYPGGLTDVEEAFAGAMEGLATRRQRRLRSAAIAAIAILLAVATTVGTLWRQSVHQTRRAEAAKLLALGQLALQEERTRALAYATASLEMADTAEARLLALRALWEGPPASIVSGSGDAWWVAFAPDGGQLVFGDGKGLFHVLSRDSEAPIELTDYQGRGKACSQNFSPDGRRLVGWASDAGTEIRVWNTERWQNQRVFEVENVETAWGVFGADSGTVFSVGFQPSGGQAPPAKKLGRYVIQRWRLEGGEPDLVGSVEATWSPPPGFDFARNLLAVGVRDTLFLHRIEALGREPPRIVGKYPETFALRSAIAFDPNRERLAACDAGGNLLIWSLDGDGTIPERRLRAPRDPMWTEFSHDGRFMAHASRGGFRLWDLEGPTGTEPLTFEDGGRHITFTPDDRWLATAGYELGVALWPLGLPYSRILGGHEGGVAHVAFSADGSHLFTQGLNDGKVLRWGLSGGAGLEPVVVFQGTPQWGWGIEVDPEERFLIAGTPGGSWRVPLDGGEPALLEGFPRQRNRLDPTGRYLAGNVFAEHTTRAIHVLDLETGERHAFEPPGPEFSRVSHWEFDHAGRLLVSRGGTLSRWDLETRVADVLIEEDVRFFNLGPDGRSLFTWIDGTPHLVDTETSEQTPMDLPAGETVLGAGPTGAITITRTRAGEILVSPIGSAVRHHLLGHQGFVRLAIASPDGKWIASTGEDGTLRLWPMPDFTRPPFHTLPNDDLMQTLRALTNLRVVPDDESSTGYMVKADMDVFRGWETVPAW